MVFYNGSRTQWNNFLRLKVCQYFPPSLDLTFSFTSRSPPCPLFSLFSPPPYQPAFCFTKQSPLLPPTLFLLFHHAWSSSLSFYVFHAHCCLKTLPLPSIPAERSCFKLCQLFLRTRYCAHKAFSLLHCFATWILFYDSTAAMFSLSAFSRVTHLFLCTSASVYFQTSQTPAVGTLHDFKNGSYIEKCRKHIAWRRGWVALLIKEVSMDVCIEACI